MNDQKFIELATKCISNEASQDEEQLLQKLLTDVNNKRVYDFLIKSFESGALNKKNYDEEKGFQKLTEKIRLVEPGFMSPSVGRAKLFFLNPVFTKVAAAVAFIMLISSIAIYYSGILEQKKPVIAWFEKSTEMGEKSIVTLLDGTTITLNADSKLKYPRKFEDRSREIYLEGEAYFEVAHDTAHPFIVHASNISTTVLGTHFNVSAFEGEKEITVSLVEGSVKVSADKNRKGEVILSPKQQLVFDREDETSKVEIFNSQSAIGWKDNIFVFNDERLEKIFVQLERTYGVRFELADKSFKNKKIKANFKSESLWTVVEVIKHATGLSAKSVQENNDVKKIVFYKK